MLDYDKTLYLDSEELAEGGILRAYQPIREVLSRFIAEPAEVQEALITTNGVIRLGVVNKNM